MRWWAVIIACGVASATWAANPTFQTFFFAACGSPSGALASRCAETTGGLGNVSGDSESSLYPNQTLTGVASGLEAARSATEQARDRAERLGEGGESDGAIELGRFSILFNARAHDEDYDRQVDVDQERAWDGDGWGAELGVDYRVNDRLVVGVLATHDESKIEFDRENPGVNFAPTASNAGEIDADRLGVTAFAALDFAVNAYLQLSGGFLESEQDVSRNSVFQESQRLVPQTNVRTEANVDGSDTFASALVGWVHEQGAWSFGPYAGLNWSKSKLDSYREDDALGTGLAMIVEDFEEESLLATLGVRVARGISFGGGLALPELRVEYAHEFERDPQTMLTRYVLDTGNSVLSLQDDDPDEDYYNVGIGVSFVLPGGWLPFVDYQAILGYDDFGQSRLTAGLRREL